VVTAQSIGIQNKETQITGFSVPVFWSDQLCGLFSVSERV